MSNRKQFEGVLLDKDGTLFDFQASWAAWMVELLLRMSQGNKDLARRAGLNLGFEIESRVFSSSCPAVAGSPALIVESLSNEFPHIERQRIVELTNEGAAAAKQIPAVPLVPLLAELEQLGCRIGLATNDSEHLATLHLDEAGILDSFEFIAGYDSGFGEKPDCGMLDAFCRDTGIPAEATVMVGDSPHDLLAGRAAGMTAVGVLTGVSEYWELAPIADAVLESIGDLPAWISRVGSQGFDTACGEPRR